MDVKVDKNCYCCLDELIKNPVSTLCRILSIVLSVWQMPLLVTKLTLNRPYVRTMTHCTFVCDSPVQNICPTEKFYFSFVQYRILCTKLRTFVGLALFPEKSAPRHHSDHLFVLKEF